MLDLFGHTSMPIPNIQGLSYHPNFLNKSEQLELLALVDAAPWRHDLKRRVQHYGWRYDYQARRVLSEMYLGPLPDWLQRVSARLPIPKADQVIVNEYQPGQGIASHIDCLRCFDGTIASLSLGGSVIIDFSHPQLEQQRLLLESGSLLILKDSARYEWLHGIAPRQYDTIFGRKLARSRRVSLTFRRVTQ